MKSLYIKDKNRRLKFQLVEKKKLILKYIFNNLTMSEDVRKTAFLEFLSLSKDNSITKIKNRCIITNRAKSIYRKFKMSRIFLKKNALEGNLTGVKKASW